MTRVPRRPKTAKRRHVEAKQRRKRRAGPGADRPGIIALVIG